MSLVREKVLEAQGTGEYGVVGALEVKGGGLGLGPGPRVQHRRWVASVERVHEAYQSASKLVSIWQAVWGTRNTFVRKKAGGRRCSLEETSVNRMQEETRHV